MDFRVGGSFTQKMQLAGTGEFSFSGQYDEIVEPESIVYHANLGQAITRVVVEFSSRAKERKLVLTHEGCPDEMFARTSRKAPLNRSTSSTLG